MALGTLTRAASMPTHDIRFIDLISFLGDSAYPTGGTAAMQAKIRTLCGDNREVIALLPQDCGGYVAIYDKAADKLKVYRAAAQGDQVAAISAATAAAVALADATDDATVWALANALKVAVNALIVDVADIRTKLNAGAPGGVAPLTEVANAVDLSGTTFKMLVIAKLGRVSPGNRSTTMAAISLQFGSGGANLVPGGNGGTPSLATALRDIADDLAGLQVAEIVSPDATDDATTWVLVNEIKTALNAVNGYALTTTKA